MPSKIVYPTRKQFNAKRKRMKLRTFRTPNQRKEFMELLRKLELELDDRRTQIFYDEGSYYNTTQSLGALYELLSEFKD